MHIVLVDFDHEFEEKFITAAAAQTFSVSILKADTDRLTPTPDSVDLYLIALQPGVERFRRLRELKGQGANAVVVVSDRSDPVDSVVALELGADEYLPKDCDVEELLASMRAVLRRLGSQSSTNIPKSLTIGSISLDAGSRDVHIGGFHVKLTTSEFEILRVLMESAGRTVPREDLARCLTQREFGHTGRALDVHVSHLRRKLGQLGGCIKTVRSEGYQLIPSEAIAAAGPESAEP